MANPASSFNLEYAYIGGVFRTDQQVYDDSYMIVPLSLARSLFNYDKEVTAVELKVKDSGDIAPVKKEIDRGCALLATTRVWLYKTRGSCRSVYYRGLSGTCSPGRYNNSLCDGINDRLFSCVVSCTISC